MKPHSETWKEMDCTFCECDVLEVCPVCERNRCFECKRGCEC